MLAGAAALFATQDYFERQERDEISRRFVDDGFERLGRELAAEYSRLEIAYKDAVLLVELADMGDRVGCALLTTRLTTGGIATMAYEPLRVTALLRDTRAITVVATAYSDLASAGHFYQLVVPLLAQQALAKTGANGNAHADALKVARVQLKGHWDRVNALRFEVQTGLVSLSVAFQASRVTRFEQLADVRRLKPFGETLSTVMVKSWAPAFQERHAMGAVPASADPRTTAEAANGRPEQS